MSTHNMFLWANKKKDYVDTLLSDAMLDLGDLHIIFAGFTIQLK